MYKSPIELLFTDIQNQIIEQQDEKIYEAVVHFVPNVNKEELLRALRYDRGQYEKGYADGIAESRWISVNERLPDEHRLVLCRWTRGTGASYGFARYNYDNDVWYVSNEGMPEVTHWMPLPQPPKGE